jgi:hypothetical protein
VPSVEQQPDSSVQGVDASGIAAALANDLIGSATRLNAVNLLSHKKRYEQ